jgi:hypothetical protein
LNYIRTLVVNQKSGFRNLRNIEEEKEKCSSNKNILEIKKSNKRKKSSVLEEKDLPSSSDELDKNKSNNLLTKEKIMELQGYNYLEIKNFIFSLPLYGSEVNLEKFTPNGEKYSASKIKESLINIQISKFCKKIEEKLGTDNFKKKKLNLKIISTKLIHLKIKILIMIICPNQIQRIKKSIQQVHQCKGRKLIKE